jgi:hypothetical protein
VEVRGLQNLVVKMGPGGLEGTRCAGKPGLLERLAGPGCPEPYGLGVTWGQH